MQGVSYSAVCSSILLNGSIYGKLTGLLENVRRSTALHWVFWNESMICLRFIREWSQETHLQASEEGRIGEKKMTDNAVWQNSQLILKQRETRAGLALQSCHIEVSWWGRRGIKGFAFLHLPVCGHHCPWERVFLQGSQSLRSRLFPSERCSCDLPADEESQNLEDGWEDPGHTTVFTTVAHRMKFKALLS